MKKKGKDFLSEKELIFVGYSSKQDSFSRRAYDAMLNAGLKVYPVNSRKNNYNIKVYNDVNEISGAPRLAYVLLNPQNTRNAVEKLAKKGIKKILFQSKKNLSQDIVSLCNSAGIEFSAFCPLMVFGKGFHKVHAFFAGV